MWYQYIEKTCTSFKGFGNAHGKVKYRDTIARTGYMIVKHGENGGMHVKAGVYMTRDAARDELDMHAMHDFSAYALYGLIKVKTRVTDDGNLYSLTWERG